MFVLVGKRASMLDKQNSKCLSSSACSLAVTLEKKNYREMRQTKLLHCEKDKTKGNHIISRAFKLHINPI